MSPMWYNYEYSVKEGKSMKIPIISVHILDNPDNEEYILYLNKKANEYHITDASSTLYKSDTAEEAIRVIQRLYGNWKTYKFILGA